jgi:type I restriction enzyme S subunit
MDSHLLRIQPNPELVTPEFLATALQSENVVGRQVAAMSHGSIMAGLSSSIVRRLAVPLPPLREQPVLSAILDTLDTTIRQTEAVIGKLEQVKRGLLHDLLTRGIDANRELRPPHSQAPGLYKDSPLGPIPREWMPSTIGAEFDIQLGKMLDEEGNSGVLKPYLGNRAVQWDRIDVRELQVMAMSRSDLARFRLQIGDLLVCEGGEVGRAAIWQGELEECYYQKALHRLRPHRDFEPRLLLLMLRHLSDGGKLVNYVSQTSIAHLTQEKLSSVPIPVPPASEQCAITEVVIAHDAWIETEARQLAKLRFLQSGLTEDLLTGRVRVTPLLKADAA